MKCEVIVLGDIEMGGGTLTDDFIADVSLSKLIKSYSRKNHPIELVLNGDTFDFLKCPYIVDGRRSYPRHITPSISLKKLQDIYTAHRAVFLALKYFIAKPDNQVTFTIGNHDHDLFFKEIQKEIRLLLGNKKNISFALSYQKYGINAEHGQQYDLLNKINRNRPFIKYKGHNILNIPWVALGIISRFLTLKEEHPMLERIFPRPLLFSHHKTVVKKLSWRSIEYLFKSLFYYPLRYIQDPTYFLPRTLLRELYRRVKKFHWDVDSIVDVFKRQRKRMLSEHRVHILGHVHQHYIEESKFDWVLLHPDTWRDEYILDNHTKKIVPKAKHYIHLQVQDNLVHNWEMVEWPIKQKSYLFSEVIADELTVLQKAAKAEAYKFMLR